MPKTICLIYNVYFAGLQHSAVNIQQQMCRIRAHKNHLKLKCTGFSEISSQYARNIHAEGVAIWKFLAADVEGIESTGAVGAVFEQVFF